MSLNKRQVANDHQEKQIHDKNEAPISVRATERSTSIVSSADLAWLQLVIATPHAALGVPIPSFGVSIFATPFLPLRYQQTSTPG